MDATHDVDLGILNGEDSWVRLGAGTANSFQEKRGRRPLTKFMKSALETVASKINRTKDARHADLEIFNVKLTTLHGLIDALREVATVAADLKEDVSASAQAHLSFSESLGKLTKFVPAMERQITDQVCIVKSMTAYTADLVCSLESFLFYTMSIVESGHSSLHSLNALHKEYLAQRKGFDAMCGALSGQQKRTEAAAAYNKLQGMHESFQARLDMFMQEKEEQLKEQLSLLQTAFLSFFELGFTSIVNTVHPHAHPPPSVDMDVSNMARLSPEFRDIAPVDSHSVVECYPSLLGSDSTRLPWDDLYEVKLDENNPPIPHLDAARPRGPTTPKPRLPGSVRRDHTPTTRAATEAWSKELTAARVRSERRRRPMSLLQPQHSPIQEVLSKKFDLEEI